MWRGVRTGLGALAIAALCLPLSFVVTVMLVPLWRWIEARYGIEAIGHSGPAEWAFYTVLALLVVPSLVVYWRLRAAAARRDRT